MPHEPKPKLPEWLVFTTDGDAGTTLHGSTNDDKIAADLLAAFPGSVAVKHPHASVPKVKTPKPTK
jgi:hypothetical protein